MATLRKHRNYILFAYYTTLLVINQCADTYGQNTTTNIPTNTTERVVQNNTGSVVQTNVTVTLNVSVSRNIPTTDPNTAQFAPEENTTFGVYQNKTVNDSVTGNLPITNLPIINRTTQNIISPSTNRIQEATSTDTITTDFGQANDNAAHYKFYYQNLKFYVIVFSISGGVVILMVSVCTVFCVRRALRKRKQNKCVISHSVLEQIQFQNPEHQVSMNFYQNNTLARNQFQTFGQSQQFNNQIFSVELPDRFLLDPPEENSNSVQKSYTRPGNILEKKEAGNQEYEVLQERVNRPYDTLTKEHQISQQNSSKKSSFKTLTEKIQQNFAFRGSKRGVKLPDKHFNYTTKKDGDEEHDYDEPTDIKPHNNSGFPGHKKNRNRLSAL